MSFVPCYAALNRPVPSYHISIPYLFELGRRRVKELLKSRYNIGREPNLYFYREQSGVEIDAVMIERGTLPLYEIKAGKTLRKGCPPCINAEMRPTFLKQAAFNIYGFIPKSKL